MARIPRIAEEKHAAAMRLVDSGRALTLPERDQVMEDYREDAQHLNGRAGAFFTPIGLANDLALHIPDGARVLDLCAGIGRLAYACGLQDPGRRDGASSVVCVEQNQDYVKVGKAAVPWATWICADVFDVETYRHLGPFDCVISNPPFGRIKTGGALALPKYTGTLFEFRLIELATRLAPYGAFIVPQQSAPFEYSGRRCMEPKSTGLAHDFEKQTGIHLRPNVGIDTACYRNDWNGTAPTVEIVVYDPEEDRLNPGA